MVTAFVVRTVFIRCLSEDYLGVNGLYSSILSMLSLVELGFGTAMVYSMYRPLAEKNYEKLKQLMNLYRRVYFIVGTVILAIGLCLVPFLDKLIKNQPDIKGLTFYYILFLINTVVSYWFFAYRCSILQADQKAYIVSNYNSIFNIVKSVLQIVVLVCFHNYTIYLLVQIVCTVGQNIVQAIRIKKEYPLVFEKTNSEKLPVQETKKIFCDVKALMLSRVSHVVLNSTDNIIISAIVGIRWVGLLSNFNMITEAVTGILTQITGAIQASLGNFFAKEEREAGYRLFCRVDFLNYWLYGFSTIALAVLLNPFITLWIGERFALSSEIVVALSINFFVAGFMNTLWTFRSTLGLFAQGQYRPLIVAALNIILSIALGYKFGLAGVLAATSLSRACVNLWYDPWLLHRDGFGKSVKPFYCKYMFRLLLLLGIGLGMHLLSNVIFFGGITYVTFIIMMILVVIIPNSIMLVIFSRTDELKYFVHLFLQFVYSRRKQR